MINSILDKAKIGDVLRIEDKRRNYAGADKKQPDAVVGSEESRENEKGSAKEAAERIVNVARLFNRKIHIEIEEDLNMMVVKVVDTETDEIIRQIPPEELVELSKNARDLKGLLINKEG